MLGQLKDRFLSLQEEITSSVKNLTPTEVSPDLPKIKKKDLEAGSELLETWQNNWEDIHLLNEQNAKSADRCDKMIIKIKKRSEQQKSDVHTLQNQLPKVNQGIKEIMEKLGCLESLLGDVEISLLALEDTIDAREMQEKQLDQRFQLAMYQERRKAEFNELANRLQNEYDKKKNEYEKQKNQYKKDQCNSRQQYYQQKFEEDMEKFKSSPQNRLQVPLRHDPDASLESVDLDDPEEKVLESFLYDVSPLPRDETPLQKVDELVPINIIQDSSPTDTVTPPLLERGASRAESLYYTPDHTAEKLSEISLN